MSDERATRPAATDSAPWLDWIVKPLRHLLGGHAAGETGPLAPHGTGPRARERGPIVEHSRAGDVYRL